MSYSTRFDLLWLSLVQYDMASSKCSLLLSGYVKCLQFTAIMSSILYLNFIESSLSWNFSVEVIALWNCAEAQTKCGMLLLTLSLIWNANKLFWFIFKDHGNSHSFMRKCVCVAKLKCTWENGGFRISDKNDPGPLKQHECCWQFPSYYATWIQFPFPTISTKWDENLNSHGHVSKYFLLNL